MKLVHIKLLRGGELVAAEAVEFPIFVKKQTRNNIWVHCQEPQAQGLLPEGGSVIYPIQNRYTSNSDEVSDLVAVLISETEYDNLVLNGFTPPDPEDTDPVEPPNQGTEILTRAQLTEKVLALEGDNARILSAIEKGLAL